MLRIVKEGAIVRGSTMVEAASHRDMRVAMAGCYILLPRRVCSVAGSARRVV